MYIPSVVYLKIMIKVYICAFAYFVASGAVVVWNLIWDMALFVRRFSWRPNSSRDNMNIFYFKPKKVENIQDIINMDPFFSFLLPVSIC